MVSASDSQSGGPGASPGEREVTTGNTSAVRRLSWGLCLESPGNFSGPKSNIQIEIQGIRARVLASKLLHFVSPTDSFIVRCN